MTRYWFVGLFIALMFAEVSTPAARAADWKAGTAKRNITPAHFMWMSGYGGRNKPAEGKATDLWAKALALEDPQGQRGLLITLDLVGIDRDLSAAVCRDIQQKFRLPRAGIILSTSHTHCGPVVGTNLGSMYFLDDKQQQLVKDNTARLHRDLVEVAGEALQALQPARLAWGIGQATFAVNRRNNKEPDVPKLREAGQLKGPVDHDVPVLAVRDAQDRLLAVAFGYACHATTMSYYEWSGDYPGYAQIELEKAHPKALALFWAGCGGDQNPLPRRTVALAQGYGKQLADAVDTVLQKSLKPVDGGLATTYTELALPLAELPNRDQLAQDALSKNRYIASRAKNLLKEMEKQGTLRAAYPYPIQVWRLGKNVDWITLGGEVVVDYALRLKRETGPGQTWVMGYANDVMAYIPSLRVLKEGGYEGGGSMVYYGLPTVWGPRVEELIVAAVREQVEKVRGKASGR